MGYNLAFGPKFQKCTLTDCDTNIWLPRTLPDVIDLDISSRDASSLVALVLIETLKMSDLLNTNNPCNSEAQSKRVKNPDAGNKTLRLSYYSHRSAIDSPPMSTLVSLDVLPQSLTSLEIRLDFANVIGAAWPPLLKRIILWSTRPTGISSGRMAQITLPPQLEFLAIFGAHPDGFSEVLRSLPKSLKVLNISLGDALNTTDGQRIILPGHLETFFAKDVLLRQGPFHTITSIGFPTITPIGFPTFTPIACHPKLEKYIL